MPILPVVAVEQVILQSPAMLPERIKEQRREEGLKPGAGTPETDLLGKPTPISEIDPVRPVQADEPADEGVEKERDSEYPSGGVRRKNGSRKKNFGRTGEPGRRLDIQA